MSNENGLFEKTDDTIQQQAVSAMQMQGAQYYEEQVKETAEHSSFVRMGMAFVSPIEMFKDIAREPKPLMPILLLVVIALASAFMQMDVMVTYLNDTYASMGMPQEQIDAVMGTAKMSALIVTPLLIIFSMLVKAGFTNLLAGPLGAETTYKTTLAVVAYAYVVQALGLILRTVATMVTGSYGLTFSPAILVDLKTQPALSGFLANFDLFNIWYLVLSVIGFSIVGKVSKGKAAVAIMTPAIIFVIITAGMAMMGGPK